MIASADEFVSLREKNDARATRDTAPNSVWQEVIKRYPPMKEWIVENKTVPSEILRVLASDPDERVRFAVAMRRRCGHDILEQLARDPIELVRYRVVLNPKIPLHVLRLLVGDPSPRIAEAARQRLAEDPGNRGQEGEADRNAEGGDGPSG